MAKILSIVETAYRATIEEQDDTVLWFNHILKSAGGDVSILLRANAVNYAVQGQDASGLHFGALGQARPPEIDKDVAALIKKETPLYVITEDAAERGLAESEFVSGVQPLSRRALPQLLNQFDQVWHW
jgi:sulfur relay (sulfurtransferase) DsrF/TusC family protein